MEASVLQANIPYVVVVNLTLVSLVLVLAGRFILRGALTDGVPGPRQNVGEFMLDFFVGKAREMGGREVVMTVASFLATCFFVILLSNAVGMVPIPMLNYPPTAFFSVTLALALCAVIGTLIISGVFNGLAGAIKHLFWPNPLQSISEVTDVLSLSLRLFGNIGGEYMTVVLVTRSVAIGIPLILHVLGLIPTFVQALVFTLLTTSFIAGAVHRPEEVHEGAAAAGSGEGGATGGTGKAVVEGVTESEDAPADSGAVADSGAAR